MQVQQQLHNWLLKHAKGENCLFRALTLKKIFNGISHSHFKSLLSRSVKAGILTRVCRGIYLYEHAYKFDGLLLYKIATLLRGGNFNYLSLESVLSDAGVISQIPLSSIFVMSSGRSSVIDCGRFGVIEFVHTKKKPPSLKSEIFYDEQIGMWRATVKQALADLKKTGRNLELIDWDEANEYL